MTFPECREESIWPYCALAAWFVQMGVHEGMHAVEAYRRGDPTADMLGKRSINPLAHIDFGKPMSVIATVVIPIVTVFYLELGIALGMAWVPINPRNFRRTYRDWAMVSLAGPFGNFLVCVVCLVIHFGVLQWLPENRSVAAVETLFCAIYVTSILYGVFNLVPIPPFDGSRVVYWLGGPGIRPFFDQIQPFGFLIVVVLFRVVPGVAETFFAIVGLLTLAYS
jgi:Zn-dependent protease